MLKISKLRDSIVFDESYKLVATKDKTLLDKLGGIEGLKEIVANVFKLILNDKVLSKFYQKNKISTIQNKYTYFIANQIGATLDLIAPDINQIHENVLQTVEPIHSSHMDIMIDFYKQVLTEQNIDPELINMFVETLN
jgi:truncated hemoglobin YjbI